ncbi:hypothetical protein COU14_01115 [Candidatus Kaiserbacteria bacterium CG10_big_fil_rev_8_21_14_0_10_44_10]|uniref:O-antigen ligase-related domain-containing protein n=1 Tax=Candidatus Kaiserbacteria bacterium CG10_big_fil_rev_8_21_14_0_10_44_10 TaxID=1974606 RepID=A0A2H0UJV9_9BACT|nr:MAG: hypothetical protein COU14_01115 [Candidatus Kaiserbacteria bacterium CG10_big_fil_rev_8_21_14_0_10_44_10]
MKDFLKVVMYGAVFAVPFVLLIVSGTMFFPYITGKNFTFRILVEVAFASWFLLMLIDRVYRPRFSMILVAVASMVGVMFFANLFGEYAPKSFWSNYERMEGWVTLVHFFMYIIVLGSVLRTEKLWNWFLNTALAVAVIMSFYALGQVAGVTEVSQGADWRVDGRLGNSTYLGVYMLFHMFIAAWMFLRAKTQNVRILYGVLFFMFAFILFRTGTRGTILGLIGGSTLAFSYLALMAPKGAGIKKIALGGLLAVLLLVGGLWTARDTDFVQNTAVLNRMTSISLSEGGIRFTVWSMAIEGVKERPILGWGQENFNYVFNKYYDPALFGAEAWYDRTHNIFFDWLIAGGVLGLLAYLSVLASALWYAIILPTWSRFRNGVVESTFSVQEQALILGLLAAYMFHNLFVFDNLASWIFYAVVLALVHSRVSQPIKVMEDFSVDRGSWERITLPSVVIAVGAVIYFVNVPGILAAKDIINAYRTQNAEEILSNFELAFSRGTFAEQEVVEQLTQVSSRTAGAVSTSAEDKALVRAKVEERMKDLIAEKPNEARLHVILGGFYRSIGDLDQAMNQLNIAHELSPRKQAIIEEQAIVLLMAGRNDEAVQYFKRSYELDQDNSKGRVYYAIGALYAGDEELFTGLIDFNELKMREGPSESISRERIWSSLIHEPFALQAAYQMKNYELLTYILSERVKLYPDEPELRTNLAASYYEQGDTEKAIEVLEQAIIDIPSFRAEAESLIRKLRNGV